MTKYLIIWAILPVLLFTLMAWAWVKLRILNGEREQIGLVGKQLVFSLIALAISALILYLGIAQDLNEYVLFEFLDTSFLEWLIYPVVLLILAKFGQRVVKNKSRL